MSLLKPLFLSSIFFCGSSYASIEDHFKKAENKSDIHKMRNIDFIYMINLDQRPEKFAKSNEELNQYGIYPYRFSAVNGWELPVAVINDVGLKYLPGMTPLMATTYPYEAEGLPSNEFMSEYGKSYFCHGTFPGPIGCALSHLSVLKDAYDAGYETIWVMEDDIHIDKDPNRIPDVIDKLDSLVGKGNWDVLFTDRDSKSPDGKYVVAYGIAKRPDMDCSYQARTAEKYISKTQISPDFYKVSARFGTYSMIIRRSGIKKLLEFSCEHKIFLPYDMENYLHPDIKRYACIPDIVSNWIEAVTDNGKPAYKEKPSEDDFFFIIHK